MTTLCKMPSHLGKLYVAEIMFVNQFDASVVTAKTESPEDMLRIQTVVKNCFRSMTIMHSRQMKTLIDTTVGVLLVTTKKA
jgi:hypothetical protein